jgi:succinate dehydrogenase / fumarate reductase cytochrome b subunit
MKQGLVAILFTNELGQKMKSRPISPHIQVYRPQLTSVMSITHRISGSILLLMALLWVWWLAALVSGPDAYAQFAAFTGSIVGKLILIAITWALFYHLSNGIRHLLWDAGWLLNLKGAYSSGWTVIVISVLATVILWGAAL